MISAKLMKDLEKKGFELEFPGYDSNENEIIEILKERNERLNLAIPLLLQDEFDYGKIIKRLDKELIRKFNNIIIISNKIFKLEGIDSKNIQDIVKKNKIKERINKSEFEYYYGSFKDSMKSVKEIGEDILEEQINIRGKLSMNKSLSNIFAPGKMRIMNNIFNHEPLTNTELKYYYRSIRPLILSILNMELLKYVRIVEGTKKMRV